MVVCLRAQESMFVIFIIPLFSRHLNHNFQNILLIVMHLSSKAPATAAPYVSKQSHEMTSNVLSGFEAAPTVCLKIS